MPISDEKLDELLTTINSMMEGMTRQSDQVRILQDENSKLCGKMFAMLETQQQHLETPLQRGPPVQSGLKVEDEQPHSARSKAPRPTRPIIEADVDDVEWGIFLDKWRHYKKIAELSSDREICLELRESCCVQVNKLLYEFVGPADLNDEGLTEITMLKHIKSVAVKSIHKEVHRWHYSQLTQHNGETATKYVGRLKSQAVLCEYRVVCGCGCAKEVSFADQMIAQQLVAGLVNPEHQSRIMSEAHDLPNLQSKVDRLIALETTDDATSKIRAAPVQASAARSSQYRKEQRASIIPNHPESSRARTIPGEHQRHGRPMYRGKSMHRGNSMQHKRKCYGCGRSSHPEGKTLAKENCPAFGKTCDTCGTENHFAKVCRRRKSRSNFAGTDEESNFTDTETEMSECEYSEHDEDQNNECTESRLLATRAQDFRTRPKRCSCA